MLKRRRDPVDNLARDMLSGYRDSTELRSTDLICLVLCMLIYLIYLNAPTAKAQSVDHSLCLLQGQNDHENVFN